MSGITVSVFSSKSYIVTSKELLAFLQLPQDGLWIVGGFAGRLDSRRAPDWKFSWGKQASTMN